MPFFQLMDQPALFPQFCLLCRNPNGPVVDTTVDVDGLDIGRVYICLNCLNDMALLVGYMSVDEASYIEAQNAELREKNDVLPIVLGKAADAIRSIADSTVADLLGNLGIVPVADAPVEPETDGHDQGTADGDDEVARESRRAGLRGNPFRR